MEEYVSVKDWLVLMKQHEEHDYKVLQRIAVGDEDDCSLEYMVVFVQGCLNRFGGSKAFALLEYCACQMELIK